MYIRTSSFVSLEITLRVILQGFVDPKCNSCLFPELIPNGDVKHRYKVKLTGEGSYMIGGFHCLLPKDRITWGNQYIVHIYYIHIRTVVKEVNKGIRCVNL